MTFQYQKQDDQERSEKTVSVGQAVHDILESGDKSPEVGEIISEYGDSYVAQVQECIDRNARKYESPFYLVVLHKKEQWALNVLRNWFVARQTKPSMKDMWAMFPNFMHTVYEANKAGGELKLLWTLPSPQEAKVVLENFDLYDPQLVKWCGQAYSQFIDL